MPNIALFPARAANIPVLTAFVDGYPSETHRVGIRAGDEPLEDGTPVTDHAVGKQEEVELVGSVAKLSSSDASRPALAWAQIRKLAKEAIPVRVVTPWGNYPEMVIHDATANSIGGGMEFTIRLREIIRVGLTAAAVSPDTAGGPATDRTSEVPRGRVPSPPVRTPRTQPPRVLTPPLLTRRI